MLTITNVNRPELTIALEPKRFPGGETHPLVDPTVASWPHIRLTAVLKNGDDVMELLLTTDALRRLNPDVVLDLYLPYIPYARQDRVANAGEALGIKVMANLINDQYYHTVTVLDSHSNVALGLIENVVQVPLDKIIRRAYQNTDWTKVVLVAPDQGAAKKVEELAKALRCPNIVYAVKKRDTLTGKITDTKLLPFPQEYLAHDWLVVDDICDGGYTFLELGKLLRWRSDQHEVLPEKCGAVRLWITHGIFSKGYDELRNWYRSIKTTNSCHPTVSGNIRPDRVEDHAYYFFDVKDFV
ncbi:ribose-phosphate pyrophosphokinase-like domain-containing protein [Streptomyces sp. CHB9.2]|uniref:ribose-phosphate pyrophosphokinase-like domain-containing protein n=1 Tax=Streptomyces sp. CHB9.2 TaxID=2841670 RepID=UPI002094C2C2|nr:ribose-phosphate pyrophosphokinase-like domain-containing protein [Streptomyces sp. CHB9.2]MCO6704752.1 ribose-phosphate pyrophosphokinase-like domain-containing protein [Streptomyces sp. CHB9.2]